MMRAVTDAELGFAASFGAPSAGAAAAEALGFGGASIGMRDRAIATLPLNNSITNSSASKTAIAVPIGQVHELQPMSRFVTRAESKHIAKKNITPERKRHTPENQTLQDDLRTTPM